MGEERLMTDYDWPDDWAAMSRQERQRFLHAHRERVYSFWQAQAEYEQERAERVSQFRVDEQLE